MTTLYLRRFSRSTAHPHRADAAVRPRHGNDQEFCDLHVSRLPGPFVIDYVGPEERLDGLSAVLDDGVSARIVTVFIRFDPRRWSPVADHPLVEWFTGVSETHEGQVFDANLTQHILHAVKQRPRRLLTEQLIYNYLELVHSRTSTS